MIPVNTVVEIQSLYFPPILNALKHIFDKRILKNVKFPKYQSIVAVQDGTKENLTEGIQDYTLFKNLHVPNCAIPALIPQIPIFGCGYSERFD